MNGWRLQAACKDADPELFFAPDDEALAHRDARERQAKAICARCPVRAQCLRFALAQFPLGHAWAERDVWRPTGVWAGLNDDEMLRLRRNRWLTGRRIRARQQKQEAA